MLMHSVAVKSSANVGVAVKSSANVVGAATSWTIGLHNAALLPTSALQWPRGVIDLHGNR